MKTLWKILKKWLQWVIAGAIFLYLFKQYRPAQIWEALKHVNLLYFLTIAVVYFIILYVVDTFTISRTLTRFGYPIRFREVLPGRGVTYLIMNINYPASQAAFAYYMNRMRRIPIFEALSVFFFVALVDLYIVISLAFTGSFFQESVIRGVDIGGWVRTVALIAYAVFVIQLAFWRGWAAKIFGGRKIRLIEWIRSKDIFVVFKDAALKDYLKIAVMRSPIHATIVLFMFVTVQIFGAHVPIVNVLGSVPISFLIGTLPITPGGLGTTNIAIIELLSPHISGTTVTSGAVRASELIFTISIVWVFINYLLKAIVGVCWLRKVSSQLFKPTEPASHQKVVSEATHLMGDI